VKFQTTLEGTDSLTDRRVDSTFNTAGTTTVKSHLVYLPCYNNYNKKLVSTPFITKGATALPRYTWKMPLRCCGCMLQ